MQEEGGWGRVAEDGCCLCSRRLSRAWQRWRSGHSAALTGLSHSHSPQGPWLCTDTCTLEGHSDQHHGGAQSQCWKVPSALPPATSTATGQSRAPRRGASSVSAVGASASLLSLWVCPAEQEPVHAHSHVSTHTRCPAAPGLLAKVTCPTWAPEPGEAQQRLLPRMFLPTGEPQGVPEENRTVRYLQPDPALGLWFPPCFLFPHRPQHL